MSNNSSLALAESEPKTLQSYMRSDLIKKRFEEVLGGPADSYISTVLTAAANNDALLQCTYQSVATAAIQAATMRLSCHPQTKQAHLVPYGNKAVLVVGYKGLYDMAMRTDKYRTIEVTAVGVGGNVEIHPTEGTLIMSSYEPGVRVRKDVANLLGFLCSFTMVAGMHKTVWYSLDELEDHRDKYAKGIDRKDSAWQTAPYAMFRKTALRSFLMDWGYLDPLDRKALIEVENDADTIDGDFSDAPIEPVPALSSSEAANVLMGGDATVGAAEAKLTDVIDDEVEGSADEQEQSDAQKHFDMLTAEEEKTRITMKQRGFLVGQLDEILGNQTKRHELLMHLIGQPSTKNLTAKQAWAILRLLGLADDFKAQPEPEGVKVIFSWHSDAVGDTAQQLI